MKARTICILSMGLLLFAVGLGGYFWLSSNPHSITGFLLVLSLPASLVFLSVMRVVEDERLFVKSEEVTR